MFFWFRPALALLIIPFTLATLGGTTLASAATTQDTADASATAKPAPAVMPASPPPYRRTLPSGVHLIVAPVAGAAQTAIEVRVRVGSAYETPETNGLSHLIEHMVFKGTTTGKPGDIDRAIEALGGDQLTARTSRDSTRFATVVPNAQCNAALGIIADMLLHPAFRPDDLANEKSVIEGEMAQTNSLPDRISYSDLATLAFASDDADRLPIMGPPANLDRFTADDLRAFWTVWYRPENLTVVVVGGAPADAVTQAVGRLFPAVPAAKAASIPVTSTPAVVAPPPATGLPGIVRALGRPPSTEGDEGLITVTLAFRGPAATDTAALPAVETLVPLLAGADPIGSRAGRLGQRLVSDQHVAAGVSAATLPGRRDSLIFVSASGPSTEGARRLEAALVGALRQFTDNPISDDEVLVARADAAGDVDADDATLAGRARRLADADARGIPADLADDYADRIRAVTTAEVRAALARYLTPDHYVVTVSGATSFARPPRQTSP